MSWDWTADTRSKLAAFLRHHGLMDGMPEIVPIGDGHSNLTYLLQQDATKLVLRRPPPPPMPPGSHDVLREARWLRALAPLGLPVPQVHAIAQAGEVLDVPYYIMSYFDGAIITNDLPIEFDAQAMGFAMVDAMVALHGVDWRAAGLADMGRPEGFNRRHIQRMARLVTGADGSMPSEFAELHDALIETAPVEAGAAIIHNDLRLGNVMWRKAAPPQILAILDWELATLGDPLFDFAYLLSSFPDAGESRTPTQDLALAATTAGFPDASALTARYASATGYDLSGLNWYVAANNWKLATMYHYSRKRGLDPYFAEISHVARFLAEARRHMVVYR
jgi:aminoglycoside phosphotransferase (APT) family kinase protein